MPQLVVGLMSGTSLDGMDAALVRIAGPREVELLAFSHRPYRRTERALIDGVLGGGPIAEVARLHANLGLWAAEAVDAVLADAGCRADQLECIAFPGQTLWHEPPVVTLQLGNPAVLAERFGIKVVHDFRARDVAAGGEGAPLVPLVDALCFSSPRHARLLLNIGGMANVTWVPAGGVLDQVRAADTGPGMAVIDAVARLVDPGRPYDSAGDLARQGRVDTAALEELLADPFLSRPPPRSTGRERFGLEYARQLHHRVPGVDGVRTAVELTVAAIVSFCATHLPAADELVVSGGGTHHPVVMARLDEEMAGRGVAVSRFDECFFPSDAKEAVAFAMLGWLTIQGQPGNLPQVTGAAGPRVLGSVTPG